MGKTLMFFRWIDERFGGFTRKRRGKQFTLSLLYFCTKSKHSCALDSSLPQPETLENSFPISPIFPQIEGLFCLQNKILVANATKNNPNESIPSSSLK